MKDLHELPKIRDALSYLYVEHCRVDRHDKAIAVHDVDGKVPVPCASLSLLMLGPGTSITHAAVKTLAESGCLVIWCGEQGIRFYAQGMGETRSASRLLHQATLYADPELRSHVVVRLYRMRFIEDLPSSLTLQQLRGREGSRVREAYARASEASGVPWTGRSYDRNNWSNADPVNKALSVANSCLYGICHAAIVSLGYSPGLGFIHTGKLLSFVYDIADLYKVEITIPTAFHAAAEYSGRELEKKVRYSCRDYFKKTRLLSRIAGDIEKALSVKKMEDKDIGDPDLDAALPGKIWDPKGEFTGGINYGSDIPK